MKLNGKVAVVTGAASGMGKSIALLYAKEGAKVVATDINFDGVKETVSEIEAAGGTALALKTDVSKEEDIQKMIDTAVEKYGTLDILVNNAGIMDNMEPAGEITDEGWYKVMEINTTSIMRSTRKAIPIFQEKGKGVIINIASVGGLSGKVAGSTYTASKHAVVGFSKSTAFMYANDGIRCNVIAPGAIETNISSTMTNVSHFGISRVGSYHGLTPRTGAAEEIATAALFLASDDASFVNGDVLIVDGGWTA